MSEQERTDIPCAALPGIVYGEVAYWCALAGVVLGIIGLGWYLFGGDHIIPPEAFIQELWKGSTSEEIWQNTAGVEMKTGHWYLGYLNKSDGIAFAGIALCCMAGVLGMWAALAGLIKCPEQKKRGMYKLYVVLVLIMSIMLTLSAIGVISLKH